MFKRLMFNSLLWRKQAASQSAPGSLDSTLIQKPVFIALGQQISSLLWKLTSSRVL